MALRSMSLILMKNEGRTFKIRFAPQSLVIFLICLLLIPICLGLSVWLNIHLYSERHDIVQKQLQLQAQVDGNAQQIARLISLEQFLDARSPNLLHTLIPRTDLSPHELQSIGLTEEKISQELEDITSQLVAHNAQNSPSSQTGASQISSQSAQQEQASANTHKESETASQEKNNKELSVLEASSTQNLSASTTSNLNTEAHTNEPQNPAQTSEVDMKNTDTTTTLNVSTPEEIEEIDLLFVLLEDIHITTNSDILHINYILRNAGKKSPLTGSQRYFLLKNQDGNFIKEPLTKTSDNSFRIKYLKEVNSEARLDSSKIKSGDLLLFEIYEDDTLIYRKAHPIT